MCPEIPSPHGERSPRNRRRTDNGRRSSDRSKAHLAALIRGAEDAVIGETLDGRIESWNPAAECMYGYTAEEVTGRPVSVLIPLERQHEGRKILDHLRRGDTIDRYVTVRVRKDAGRLFVSLTVSPIKDARGRVVGISEISHDITESRNAEQRLRESEARYRELFESSRDGILSSRMDGRLTGANAAALGMLGYTLAELRELTYQQLTPERWHSTESAIVRDQIIPRGYSDEYEKEYLRKDGASVPVSIRAWLIRNHDGQPTGMWVLVRDISERRRAEEALRESEQQFRRLAEGMPHIVWETDAAGETLYQNRLWYDYTGRGPEASLGLQWLDAIHPGDRDLVRTEWTRSIRSGGAHVYNVEVRIRRHDGAYRWFRAKGAPIRNGAGRVVRWAGTCTDIDDQKRTAERLEFAQMAGEVGFFDYDFRTDQAVWSEGLMRLYGVQQKDYTGSWASWAAHVVAQDAAAVQAQTQATVQKRKQRLDVEFRVVLPDGTHRWLAGRAKFVYDAAGNPMRLTGMNVDISERKRLEKELEEHARELAEADRRKDEFLATLAHELRNPLAPIRTSADLVCMNAGENERLQWASDTISRQVRHLDRLVGDLLDLARIAQGKVSLSLEPCDLGAIVARAIEMNRNAAVAKDQRLSVSLPDEELRLLGDTSRLVQVVSNLVNNAVKYTPAGGRIDIRARPENGTVVLRVHDTGIGIEPALLPYVFDLFVQGDRTLAREEGGLGLGLTLVRKIAELHGGQVSVASRGAGQGAEFTVRLPLAGGATGEAGPATDKSDHYRKTQAPKRILIVEDNRDAADALALILGDLGHDVIVAYDGGEGQRKALGLLPDIAILDIGLPGISGYELAGRLRQEPRLHKMLLIAASGYGQASDREKSRAAGFDHHLIKPFDLQDLTAILSSSETARTGD